MAQRHDPLSNRELLILIIEGIEIMSQNSDAINKALQTTSDGSDITLCIPAAGIADKGNGEQRSSTPGRKWCQWEVRSVKQVHY